MKASLVAYDCKELKKKSEVKIVKYGYVRGCLAPKRQSPIFGPFLKFGQAIVDAVFVPKFSNFR
jgi:hypothetical protein